MITHFPALPKVNVAGNVASFLFIPEYHIYALTQIIDGAIVQPFQFNAGLNFLKGLSSLQKLEFTEETAQDANGSPVNWKVTGFFPGDDPAALKLFAQMSKPHLTYVLVITDQQQRRRLVGYNAPLMFNYSFNTGNSPGDARGFSFSFSGTGLGPAPLYNV